LPWAVRIDPAHRPLQYLGQATYQPTFLYESLWDLALIGVLWWAAERFAIRRGYLIALYAALYTFGRFWTEYLRVDEAHHILGLRLNDWVSILVFTGAVALLTSRGRARPGDELVRDPLPGRRDPLSGQTANDARQGATPSAGPDIASSHPEVGPAGVLLHGVSDPTRGPTQGEDGLPGTGDHRLTEH
ncbi:MAG: prolipoprotein diacylglyceryl transferase, partial [Candidatus Aeolococcus gillhamiae]